MDALIELLSFTLKAAVIAAVVLLIVASASRQRPPSHGQLSVRDLAARWRGYGDALTGAKGLNRRQRSALRKQAKADAKVERDGVVWVTNFSGDLRASGLGCLRETVSAIIAAADPDADQVCVRLKSPGGGVSEYGLAANEMVRLKNAGLHVTVAVEGVAASGGYMMAVVSDHIIASPFSAVGSIGVVAQVPNFHRALQKADVDVEVVTAGKHKRTLTVFGENTDEGRAKFRQDLEQIHALFKQFVTRFRPSLDLDAVADGGHWFGEDALKLGLVDEIGSVDDYLMDCAAKRRILLVEFKRPRNFGARLGQSAALAIREFGKRLGLISDG